MSHSSPAEAIVDADACALTATAEAEPEEVPQPLNICGLPSAAIDIWPATQAAAVPLGVSGGDSNCVSASTSRPRLGCAIAWAEEKEPGDSGCRDEPVGCVAECMRCSGGAEKSLGELGGGVLAPVILTVGGVPMEPGVPGFTDSASCMTRGLPDGKDVTPGLEKDCQIDPAGTG